MTNSLGPAEATIRSSNSTRDDSRTGEIRHSNSTCDDSLTGEIGTHITHGGRDMGLRRAASLLGSLDLGTPGGGDPAVIVR